MSTLILPSLPAAAITAKQKKATCEFGAKEQKLAGKERAAFMKKCMSNKNDPRGSGPPGTTAPAAEPPDQG